MPHGLGLLGLRVRNVHSGSESRADNGTICESDNGPHGFTNVLVRSRGAAQASTVDASHDL